MANSNVTVDKRSQLITRKKTGEDELVDAILSGENTVLADMYTIVKELHSDKVQRSYVEASLLTQADLEDISSILEVPEDVLDLYEKLYYSVSGLTRLQRLSVLSSEKDTDIRQFKSWALTQGLDFIRWRIGGEAKITPVGGLMSLFKDAYFKSKEAFFNVNEAEASKESAKWVKQTAELARLLKAWTTDSDEVRKDLEIALQSITEEDVKFESIEELGIELYKAEDEPSDLELEGETA